MTKESFSDKVNRLFAKDQWEEARQFLEAERAKDPGCHWVLTQLGVTYYEQQRYKEALRLFLKSKAIVPDCPLTLWQLAGAYDALGKHRAAIAIYTWLLKSAKSADEDPCWESKEWTDALMTDCAYALGESFQALGKRSLAEHWYRQYIDLLLAGAEGNYAIEDARKQINRLHEGDHNGRAEVEFKKVKAYLTRQGSTGKQKKAPTRSSQGVDQRLKTVVKRRAAAKS